MVDVDRRLNVGQHAHIAGLKRLSARASKGQLKPTASPRKGCFNFGPLARAAMDRLNKGKVQIAGGLMDEEFCKIEALFAFTFPPDLKAILQEGLPVGAGFPDWRSGSFKQLRLLLNLPITGLSYEVACERFWLKQWGLRPSNTEEAVTIACSALKKAPILIPVYRHCYIPSSPNLAGNPIFFVRQQEVFCCGFDLADFFEKHNFVLPDFELVCDFARLDALNRTATSLRSSHAQSFRVDSSGRQPSSASRKTQVEDVDLDELTDWSTEESSGDLEGWGRNLDAMAKRSGHDAQSRGSFELQIDKTKVPRRYNLSLDLSSCEHHANDRAASVNVSTIVRRIDFWSDLAKKTHISSNDCLPLSETGHLDHQVERSSNESLDQALKDGDDTFSCIEVGNDFLQTQTLTPYWLERYFDKMALVLRSGGWKETDIADMFDLDSTSNRRKSTLPMNPQSIMQGLVLYVNFLSDALRRAGWGSADVAEAFDVDFPFCEQRRRTSALPPHVAARIGKLAEYAARM